MRSWPLSSLSGSRAAAEQAARAADNRATTAIEIAELAEQAAAAGERAAQRARAVAREASDVATKLGDVRATRQAEAETSRGARDDAASAFHEAERDVGEPGEPA